MFAKLSQEDEEFRRKIVDLHRKLSDVDADNVGDGSDATGSPSCRGFSEAERLSRELEAVARRAEETSSRNAAEAAMNAVRKRERMIDGRREDSGDDEISGRREYDGRPMERLRLRSRRTEEDYDDQTTGPSSASETNFLNRFRLKRRSLKLLSFLSGKASDRSQEERAARLLRMYMPDQKGGSRTAQNTISIHHTSRDRRFWKLRNRRRTSSA